MLNETRRTQNDGKMRTRTAGGTRAYGLLLTVLRVGFYIMAGWQRVATYRLDYLSMAMRKRVEQIRMTAVRGLPCGVVRQALQPTREQPRRSAVNATVLPFIPFVSPPIRTRSDRDAGPTIPIPFQPRLDKSGHICPTQDLLLECDPAAT